MKLEKLTPEQEQKAIEVRDFWKNYIFSCQNSINKEQAKIGIDWLYKFSNQKSAPIIIYVDSPMGCQIGVAYLKEFFKDIKMASVWASVRASVRASVWASVGDSVGDSVRDSVWDSVLASVRDSVWASVWASVRDSVRDSVWDSVGDSVGDSVRDSVWDSVRDSVRASVRDSVRASVGDSKLEFNSFSYYGNIGDYGWVSFFDFFQQIGILKHNDFEKFKNLLLSGVYDMIQLDGFCIVSDMPIAIKRRDDKLHCENDMAIKWKDGYGIYYWRGTNVPEKWIMRKDEITKEDILSQDNAEKRRCLMEILGAKKYYDIISDGKGLSLIDEDIDAQGFPMKLYETTFNDSIIDKKVQFIEVVCPSTERVYNIYPPNQQSKNVWQAKASTFSDKKIKYRHGDVALLQVDKKYKQPILES